MAAPSPDTLERMARFVCEWEGSNPDESLNGDGQNFRWMEYQVTVIEPLLAMLEPPA